MFSSVAKISVRFLIVFVISFGVLCTPALAADPLVPQQDWLARVVAAGLPSPTKPIPPIAIIEDGFDASHPEMAGGWITQRRITAAPEPEGIAHGTAVASVIGAPRNGVGIEGVLPGATVWVYASTGYCRDTAAAIRQAANDGAKVINMSYGFTAGGACKEHRDATSYAFGLGAVLVASAGNGRPTQPWQQPGDDPHVLTVSAVNRFDQPAYFSNQNTYSDISAPGEGILVAVPAAFDTEDGVADGYRQLDGTSFAAPMVAAAAAWIKAERPTLTSDQVAEVLRRSARDLGKKRGWDISTGWGLVDIKAALTQPAPIHDAFEPNDDIAWMDGRNGFVAARPYLRTRTRDRIEARLDINKDDTDVYPVWIPARQTVTAVLRPRYMYADLIAWVGSAKTTYGPVSQIITGSAKKGLAVEKVRVTNYSSRGRKFYLEVRGKRGGYLSGDYTLTLVRG